MKKIVLLAISLLIMTVSLSAQLKLAILPYDTMDSKSKTLKTQFEKIDIKKTFGADNYFELINAKQTAKTVKNAIGSQKLYEVSKDVIINIGNTLGADLVLSGTIGSVNSNTFNLNSKAYNVTSGNMTTLNLTVTKVSKDRRQLILGDLIPKIKAFYDNEKIKAKKIAIQNYDQQKLDQARTDFEKLYNNDNSDFESILYLARIAFEEKNYTKCEEWALKGIALNSDDEDLAKLLGSAYQNQDKFDEAAQALTPVAIKNNDTAVWYYIGNMFNGIQEFDKAITALNEAVKIDANHAQANYRLGLIYIQQDNFETALPYLEIAANAFPEDGLIIENLALAYKKTGNLLKSIENQEAVLVSNPDDHSLYLKLNNAYVAAGLEARENGENEQAITLFDNGIATLQKLELLNAENQILYISMSHTYNTKGDTKNAEISANRAIELDDTNYAPYLILGSIYFKKGSDEYNKFSDIEQKFSKAVGKEADRLKVEKDNAQQKAIQLFTRAKGFYGDALKRADPMREATIKNSIKEVENYIKISSKN